MVKFLLKNKLLFVIYISVQVSGSSVYIKVNAIIL